MINVKFKNNYNNVYEGKEYTFKGYEGAEVGDIVAVNTVCGLAIAKVVRVDVFACENFDEARLKSVAKVIKSTAEIRKEYERKQELAKIAEEVKRNVMLNSLKSLSNKSDYRETIDKLTNSELEELLKLVTND